MMVGFPLLMCTSMSVAKDRRADRADYLWACLWYHNGKLVHPKSLDDVQPFFNNLGREIYEVSSPQYVR